MPQLLGTDLKDLEPPATAEDQLQSEYSTFDHSHKTVMCLLIISLSAFT